MVSTRCRASSYTNPATCQPFDAMEVSTALDLSGQFPSIFWLFNRPILPHSAGNRSRSGYAAPNDQGTCQVRYCPPFSRSLADFRSLSYHAHHRTSTRSASSPRKTDFGAGSAVAQVGQLGSLLAEGLREILQGNRSLSHRSRQVVGFCDTPRSDLILRSFYLLRQLRQAAELPLFLS